MYTADENQGLFSKIKSLFGSNAKSSEGDTLVADEHPEVEESTANEQVVTEPVTAYLPEAENVLEKEIAVRRVEVTAPKFELPQEKDLDIRFATRFIQQGGKFIYCETMRQAVAELAALKAEFNWSHIFAWENEIKDAFTEFNFQRGSIGYTIQNSGAAISLCESLVADEGLIILNPKQASRRRLPCFPKTHIIITDIAHLTANENSGLERFYKLNKGELPSIIKLGSCNNGNFYDKNRLILNSEGPEDVYVILIDEIIQPSLRP